MKIKYEIADQLRHVSYLNAINTLVNEFKEKAIGIKHLNLKLKTIPIQLSRISKKSPFSFSGDKKTCTIEITYLLSEKYNSISTKEVAQTLSFVLESAAKKYCANYMKEHKQAFILVGHSNWGKSETLKAITNGNYRIKNWKINDKKIFIKRSSNDDYEYGLLFFVQNEANKKEKLILTFCPSFFDQESKAREILDLLTQNFIPYFFILKHKYSKKRTREIPLTEIEILKEYGNCFVLETREEAKERAKLFTEFIDKHIW